MPQMPHRLVIAALPGSAPGAAKVDAPSVMAIRLVYGVGTGRDAAPRTGDFKPTYAVEIPIFSLGGLDPDGVYEFDAAELLRTLKRRAQRRQWGVRVELSLEQAAASVSAGDVVVTAPSDEAGDLSIVGPATGNTTEGGGRRLVVATRVVTDPEGVAALAGAYAVTLGDAPGREVKLALTRFEFEG